EPGRPGTLASVGGAVEIWTELLLVAAQHPLDPGLERLRDLLAGKRLRQHGNGAANGREQARAQYETPTPRHRSTSMYSRPRRSRLLKYTSGEGAHKWSGARANPTAPLVTIQSPPGVWCASAA